MSVINEHTKDSDIFWEKARHDGIPIPVIRAGGGQRLRRTKPQSSDAAEVGGAAASSVRIIQTRATTSRSNPSNSSMSVTKSVLFLVFAWSFILPRMKRWIVECCRDISAVKRSLDAQSRRRKSSMKQRMSQLDNNNNSNNSSSNSIRNVKKATTSTVCIVILLLTYTPIVVADRDIPSDFFKQPIVKTKKNIFQRLRLGKQRGREQVLASGGAIQIRSKISTTKSSTILIHSLVIIGIGYLIRLLMMQHRGMKRWLSERCRYISERIISSGTTSTSRSRRRVQKRGEKSRTTNNNGRLTPSSSVMDIINLIEEDSDNDVDDGDYSPLTPATGDSSLSRRRNSSFLSLLSFSSVRKRSANLPSTVDVFESVDSDMGMVDSTRPFSNVTRTSTRVSRNEHSKSFSTVMAVTEHHHDKQRRTSKDTLEDDTSQIPTMMSITIDEGKRGHDDDQKKDENNSALARKLSIGSSRVRSRR